MCVINAWVLYQRAQKQKGLKAELTIFYFRIQLAITLMMLGTTSTLPTRGRPSSNTSVTEVTLKMKVSRASMSPKDVQLD